jgi:hypothetical protein
VPIEEEEEKEVGALENFDPGAQTSVTIRTTLLAKFVCMTFIWQFFTHV